MAGHHLILGRMEDFLTGQMIDDTHDERYCQMIARRLVEEKGFAKDDIEAKHRLVVTAGEKCGRLTAAFLVRMNARIVILIHYGPGSLVTRQRPALAMGRLVAPYQVPVVVVTNGRQADVLEGGSGKLLGRGLDAIPSRAELEQKWAALGFHPVDQKRQQMEARIAFAYEIDDSCPCDDTTCRL